MTRTGTFAFVPWTRLDEFFSRGWMAVSDLGPTHGTWSVLCWHCGGDGCGVQP